MYYHKFREGVMPMPGMVATMAGSVFPAALVPKLSIRKEFPETWIWDSIDNNRLVFFCF